MGELTLYKESDEGNTIVSNCFIDHYLADANDAQIKVYLYLLRTFGCGQATSISEIADKFNHTEKDVCRALSYWEQKGLLSLDRDSCANLTGIRLKTPRTDASAHAKPGSAPSSFAPFVTLMPGIPHRQGSDSDHLAEASAPTLISASRSASMHYEKPEYTLDDIRAFKESEKTSELLFIAEQYLKKTLSANDIRSILFLTDTLHFSSDLIDYLLQYCVQRGKKDFRYIETVAVSWAEAGIKTPHEAASHAARYDRHVYTIMNALGKNNMPTAAEVDFIKRWCGEWGFSMDIILEACERTVLATDKHRFEYADKILSTWKKNNIRRRSDIEQHDRDYKKNRSTTVKKKPNTTLFTQFEQREYDYDSVERELLNKK